jgi:uncharacterized SAM-binding protein YcdF (DUF218 family)
MIYIVALGNGFEEKNGRLGLTVESKITAIAGYLYLRNNLGNKLIFSGGYTKNRKTSEARAMVEFIKVSFKNVSVENIILEEKSIDTAGNVSEVKKILPRDAKIILISFEYHLRRARLLFCNFGINVNSVVASELVLAKNSPKYDSIFKQFTLKRRMARLLREIVYYFLVRTIDSHGRIMRIVTSRTRVA